MQQENNRNLVIFIVASLLIFGVYYWFVMRPIELRRAEAARAAAAAQAPAEGVGPVPGASSSDSPSAFVDERTALSRSARVPVRTPALTGSISMTGGRIDHLYLNDYRVTLDDPATIELLRPEGMEHAYFAYVGWLGQNIEGLPGPDTQWVLRSGTELSPGHPIVMNYDNGQGLTFTRTIEVDEQFLFTITDRVDNNSDHSVTLAPYGSIQRRGIPTDLGRQPIVHEGAIGVFGDQLHQSKYPNWEDEDRPEEYAGEGGWVGVTDKYWLTAFIPEQDETFEAQFRTAERGGVRTFETAYQSRTWVIPAGRSATETVHLFAGAKRNEILTAYGEELGAPRMTDAIDWGMFWFLTKPFFTVLEFFYGLVHNFGVAILLLTVAVKLVLFPLANKAYASMSRMRMLQPKMEEIRERFKDDPAKQQQEIMAMYQREKVNPLAGCWPMLIQIPIFYSLYKVLTVTIEMRHAPFFGWIRDLSARDPSNVWNLFGLIPWDPATAPLVGGLIGVSSHVGGITLALGVLALLYGATMWLQTQMNPPPTDEMQRKIFGMMPILFTFIMAPFAAGLLIYWIWSNILTIIQQYVIMHRFKAENPIDTFIERLRQKKDA
ncbi:MAG TPA: membrane protein insertase YidC [Brevundimonas sp.]|uniref:membrane protein insertase YidC n=1 Tax=Brevundimonas sp. TaxID=1871086 RepID=UPI002B97D955|nr:membrane protein insertase YidC [Brevundimonas sp.]HRH19837.1 membrane protein insertase YidC [Brevundimonas sp.]